jgi:hypothetical protein
MPHGDLAELTRCDRACVLFLARLMLPFSIFDYRRRTPAGPGTWTAPGQIQNFPEFSGTSVGTNGIAISPGPRLGIVTGEFGGNSEGGLPAPIHFGHWNPAVVDWASFTVPNGPNGNAWSQGFDPHSVTAYVSRNSKKALGVLGDSTFAFLAIVDVDGC